MTIFYVHLIYTSSKKVSDYQVTFNWRVKQESISKYFTLTKEIDFVSSEPIVKVLLTNIKEQLNIDSKINWNQEINKTRLRSG